MCDASAAVSISTDTFVVANDEDNILRVYHREKPGGPLARFPLDSFLQIDKADKHPESDIEGASRIGSRVYWITSHGANREGKLRPNRRRFFATEIQNDGANTTLKQIGTPYLNLIEDIAKVDEFKILNIAEKAKKPPEEHNGLNIEGLTRTPQNTLLIAFRNPIINNKALLIPLENPDEVIEGKQAELGSPIFLDLNGLGIRSIEYSEKSGKYFIMAGSYDDSGKFRLYTWSGTPSERPITVNSLDMKDMHPEALIIYSEEKTKIQILSDDGDELINGAKCKDDTVPLTNKAFRSDWLRI
jgi:hypothetical protein